MTSGGKKTQIIIYYLSVNYIKWFQQKKSVLAFFLILGVYQFAPYSCAPISEITDADLITEGRYDKLSAPNFFRRMQFEPLWIFELASTHFLQIFLGYRTKLKI